MSVGDVREVMEEEGSQVEKVKFLEERIQEVRMTTTEMVIVLGGTEEDGGGLGLS